MSLKNPITNAKIAAEARRLSQSEDFQGSKGWMKRFYGRNPSMKRALR
jgi:hypothetical protein